MCVLKMKFLPSAVQKLSSEQTHRQTDGQTDRWTDRQIDRQMDRQMDRQTHRQTHRQTDSTEIITYRIRGWYINRNEEKNIDVLLTLRLS